MFGKLMSVSDDLMWRYFDLLSFRSPADLARLRGQVAEGLNPRDAKFQLARELVARFHGPAAGEAAQADFVRRFRDGGVPDEMELAELAAPARRTGRNPLVAAGGAGSQQRRSRAA